MTEFKKPTRYLEQQTTNQGFEKPNLYGIYSNVTYGGESNANFIDVISVGPVSSVESIYVDDTNINSGEFPLSEFYPHTGDEAEELFEGNFTYVERSYSISKQADLTEGKDGDYNTTAFTRSVSGKGVAGVRLIFNAPQFLHKDNKNRRKEAKARFKIHILDEDGNRVKTTNSGDLSFYSNNSVSTQLTILARDEDLERTWDYEVEMSIRVNMYGTVVSGSWSAAIVTEFFKDTQTYKDVATVSGKVVSNDVAGSLPKREYLVKGYKVDVPVYIGENKVFLGEFTKATSDSHAWNAMAVLVDTKWGAGLPLDKINITSFIEFDRYISETLSDGKPRFKHSQELIKADSYFRIASQIVGAADGKLFEDTSGRIGVLIDKQTDSRRIITSYDIQNEKVKRTTVPEKKKTNYVEVTYVDEDNEYQADIYTVQDDVAITKNGLISEKLKSDTCTRTVEAQRLANKVLTTSQVASTSYVFSVGHTHEDIQIGEVVALYDRVYSRVNYCGKTAEGSTPTRIKIDPRTPINLDEMEDPYVVFDNSRGVPSRYKVSAWTDSTLTLSEEISSIPEAFTSFGVESNKSSGLKPTLIKVLGVTDNSGVLQVEGVDYNDSIYSHVENGTDLILPKTRIIPVLQEEITGLTIIRLSTGISANWDSIAGANYVYVWKKFTGDVERDPNGSGILVESGQTQNASTSVNYPLEPARYEISVYVLDTDTGKSSNTKSVSILVDVTDSATSTIPSPFNLDTSAGGGRYLERGFTVKWDQPLVSGVSPHLMGYILRITQGGETLEVRLTSDYRSYQITSQALTETFGEDYDRDFVVRLIAYDDTLKSKAAVVRTVNNIAPIAPDVTVQITGDITLSTPENIPEDAVGSVVYIWEGSEILLPRPENALEFRSNQLAEIDLPNGTLVYDNRSYIFEAAWVDGFGERDLNFTREAIAFGPDVLIPAPLELLSATAYDIDRLKVDFTHDGVWLEKLKIYYKKTNADTGYVLEDGHTFDGSDTRVTYDPQTLAGSFILDFLEYNSEYELYTTVSNISSADSDASNTVIGSVIPYANVDDIRDDLVGIVEDITILQTDTTELEARADGFVQDIDGLRVDVDSNITDILETSNSLLDTDNKVSVLEGTSADLVTKTDDLLVRADDFQAGIDNLTVNVEELSDSFKRDLSLERYSREESDKQLFNTAAALAEFRRESNHNSNTLTDAIFEVNPEDGTIGLRAFNYTDKQFTQANILIDGVDARVDINAGKIVDLGNAVTDANSSITLLAGQVALKASYTQMTEYVSGALDAVIPAYSFGFFNSSEDWVAVNGSITQGTSLITTTWGDIENTTLNYSADENPVITLSIERMSGSGYKGDLIVTFSDARVETYPSVITDAVIGTSGIKTLNLKEESTFTGTVTGIRFILGLSVDDVYDIKSITLGKPSAQLEELEGITAQVNQLGIDLNAVEGQLTSFVTSSYYDENTVTVNNVTQVLDGEAAIISLKATQQEINSNGVVEKANSAATWIDGADATIRSSVESINAEEGGLNDSIARVDQTINALSTDLGATSLAVSNLTSRTDSLNGEVTSLSGRLSKTETDISGNTSSIETLLLKAENTDTLITSTIDRVDNVEVSSDNNATAISQVLGQVNDPLNNTSALYQNVQEAKTLANGNATAITALTNQVEDAAAGITANTGLIQEVEIKADDNTTATSLLTARVNNAETGISANASLVQAVDLRVDGTVDAISGLGVAIGNLGTDVTANADLLQVVKQDADDNTLAVSSLQTRVADTEEGVSGNATLIQSVDLKVDGNITSTTALENRVESAEGTIVTNSGLISAVEQTANGNLTAIAGLQTAVSDVESGLTGANVIISSNKADVDALKSQVNLSTISTNRLINSSDNLEEQQFYTEIVRFDQERKNLDLGESIASADLQIGSVVTKTEAVSTELLDLKATTNSMAGIVDASLQRISKAETDINGNSRSISQLELKAGNLDTEITASLSRIDKVEVTSDGNASSISQVLGQVNDPVNNTSGLYSFVQEVETKADGNANSITVLENKVGNAEIGLTAVAGLIQEVDISVEGNTTAISKLTTRVENTEEGVVANTGLIQDVDVKADGNATAITELTTRIDNTNSNVSAQAGLIQNVDNKSDGNALALNELAVRVANTETGTAGNSDLIQEVDLRVDGTVDAISALGTDVANTQGDLSTAQVLLGSTIDELGIVSSRAYLGVSDTVDGKTTVTGITADSATKGLRFQGDVIQFDDTAGSPALQYRSDLDKWAFNGQLVVNGYTIDNENDVRDLTSTNLIRPEPHWTVDTSGSQGIFTQKGSTDENKVERLVGPTGTPELVWNTFAGDNDADGGWYVSTTIDPTRSYRHSVWMKQVGGTANSLYLGCSQSNTDTLGGTMDSDPYHWSGDLPQLDKWYLAVGIIHGNGYSGGASGISGIYDPDTGERVASGTDFKNRAITYQTQRVYRYHATQPTHTAQFARPRFEEINGEEPSLATLIGRIPKDGEDGASGSNNATVYLYRRHPGSVTDMSATTTYNFGTKTLSGQNNSWSQTVPSGTDPLYIIAATASGTGSTDTITANEWSAPQLLAKSGEKGEHGLNSATVFIYKKGNGELPTVTTTYNFTSKTLTGLNYGWSTTMPDSSDGYTIYVSTATAVSTSNTDTIPASEWATAKVFVKKGDTGATGPAGADGQVGAGFYGSLYATISWDTTTATQRFTALVGRAPVQYDIFTQTRTDGADSQARQYNGSSWGTVALQVNGSIVAKDTIAGNRLVAGAEIRAPKITGGELNGAVINGGELNIKSSPSGARTEITESLIKVYNTSGNLVVRIGVW